jgi:hypothetical protein
MPRDQAKVLGGAQWDEKKMGAASDVEVMISLPRYKGSCVAVSGVKWAENVGVSASKREASSSTGWLKPGGRGRSADSTGEGMESILSWQGRGYREN